MKERLLSILLIISVVFTMLPLEVLAEEELGTLIETEEWDKQDKENVDNILPGNEEIMELSEEVASGTWTETITWVLDTDGTLTFSGIGKMGNDPFDYMPTYWDPFPDYSKSIEKIIINDGITYFGNIGLSYFTNLKSIMLSDSVTSIGASAFAQCNNLTDIRLPDNVTFIGFSAFRGCSSLTDIKLPDGITSIKNAAFENCSSLVSITLPDSVTSIENAAFKNCSSLVSITLSDSVTSIGNAAFENCSSLNSIMIPNGVTSIGEYAFGACSNLNKIVLPGSITSIEKYTFFGCLSLKEIIIPNSITAIRDYAFHGCSNLTEISIPNGVVSIGDCAFGLCFNLTNIMIPDSVISIGNDAFIRCESLTDIRIPASVTSIGKGAFSACIKLTEISVDASNKAYICKNNALFSKDETILLQYPAGRTEKFYQIPSTVTSIEDRAFSWCDHFTEIVIPDSVISIGNEAFVRCSSLADLIIPESVTSIGERAFEGCSAWTDAVIPESITLIRDFTFCNCDSLTEITIPDNVISIGDCAFNGCDGLKKVTIPDGVESIGERAFEECTNLVDIKMPDSITFIGTATFRFCTHLTNIIIPSNITVIEANIFEECHDLTSIIILNNVTLIGDGAFLACENLKEIYYTGTEEEWEGIEILDQNDCLLNAAIHYNATMSSNLKKPEDFQVTSGVLSNILSWKASAETELNSYKIYRSSASDGDYTALATISAKSATSYTDQDVIPGEAYFYKLTAVDFFGLESESAGPASGIPIVDEEPPVITSVSPKNGTVLAGIETFCITAKDNVQLHSISLEFSKDKTIWENPVTQFTSETAEFSVDTTAYDSEKFYVRIICEDIYGNKGEGATIYQYTLDNTAPEKVSGLWAESSSTIVTLHWDDVKAQDFSYFLVEAKEEDGSWSSCRKVSDAKGVNLTGMTPNTEYTFRVCAYDIRGNRGAASDPVTICTKKDTTSPVITKIQPGPGAYSSEIPMRFSVSDDHGISSVMVQLSRDGKNWKDTDMIPVSQTGTSITVSYMLSLEELADGLLYVRAIAEDYAGNQSLSDSEAPFTQYLVDKTPPDAPVGLHAEGNDGYISLSWTQGKETDLAGYTVLRAENPEGPYIELIKNLQKISYTDKNVSAGTTYYYKIFVADQAENMSEYSDAVSAVPGEDRTVPKIISISPSDGYVLGADTPIKVKVWDNIKVDSVYATYTTDTESKRLGTISVQSADSVIMVPLIPGELNSSSLCISVYCTDMRGNESEIVIRNYRIDTQAPAVPVVSAAAGDYCVNLSWTSGGEEDLAGFKIYRGFSPDGKYQLIGQRTALVSTYTDKNLTSSIDYYYYVEAIDENGNIAMSEKVGPVKPLAHDTTVPTAAISGVLSGTVGQELAFDGTRSSDNIGIVSYFWDFGDGTQGEGVEITHTYSAVGSYVIQLTVNDAAGNSASATLSVKVKEYEALGSVAVTAIDENGTSVPNAGIYFNLGTEEMQVLYTDHAGKATLHTAPGIYTIGGYCEGYLPSKTKVEVVAETTREIILTLVKKDIVAGNLEVERMTLEDIIAAGIDVGDPANQEVYEFTVQLQYGTYADAFKVISNGDGKILSDPKKVTITDSSGVSGSSAKRNVIIAAASNPVVSTGNGKTSVPTIVILDLPGTACWLKDFFDVRLTIINQAASDYVLDSCVATLDVPKGLTLLDTNRTAASSVVSMKPISGQVSRTVEWILRGDEAGMYDLTASFTAILRDFGVEIGADFKTAEPVRVRKGDNLTLEIIAENEIVADTDGAIRLGLRNDDSDPYYMPSINLSNMATLCSTFKRNGFLDVNTPLDTIYPGETIYYDYVVPRKNWETLTTYSGEDFFLMNAVVNAIGGTEIDSEITEVMPFTIAADKIEVSMVEGDVHKPIKYVGIDKRKLTKATVPDLQITTYRLNEKNEYVPFSTTVEIQDEYLKDEKGEKYYTVTTGADGTYIIPGYEISVGLANLKSYTIRFVTSRAKPVEIPVNVYGT